jgi:hypothetical protein
MKGIYLKRVFFLFVLFQLMSISTSKLLLAPALLLTTSDSISLIYPKEMGYEKDYLHIIFRLFNKDSSMNAFKIEDAVYDNRTWSIYFIISNSSGSSELFRLKRHSNAHNFNSFKADEFSYEIASNWTVSNKVIKNPLGKTKLLSMDLIKRNLYMLEFDLNTKKHSVLLFKLNNFKLVKFTFDNYMNNYFNNDGYTFITVARDHFIASNSSYDTVLFISNNQTLNICFLINMTCQDYFRTPILRTTTTIPVFAKKLQPKSDYYDENVDGIDYDVYDDYDSKSNRTPMPITSTSATTTPFVELSPPLYTFGRLMGIKYDQLEHALYLSDYDFDHIYKISFERNTDSNNLLTFKMESLETLLKTDYITQQIPPLNPIMSVLYEKSFMFWIDYEEGLKTTVLKSNCIRTVYKIKEAISLKLVFISSYQKNSFQNKLKNSENGVDYASSASLQILNNLGPVGLSHFKFRHPPDFYLFNEENYSLILKNRNNANSKTSLNMEHFSLKSNGFSIQTSLFVIILSFMLLFS